MTAVFGVTRPCPHAPKPERGSGIWQRSTPQQEGEGREAAGRQQRQAGRRRMMFPPVANPFTAPTSPQRFTRSAFIQQVEIARTDGGGKRAVNAVTSGDPVLEPRIAIWRSAGTRQQTAVAKRVPTGSSVSIRTARRRNINGTRQRSRE